MYIVLPVQWTLFFVFSTLLGSLFEPGNYANDRFSALAKKGGNAVSGVWRREAGGGKGERKKSLTNVAMSWREGEKREVKALSPPSHVAWVRTRYVFRVGI